MGLKLKKFKAKLNWKTKETVPDVVCLRYQIHSEFDDVLGVPLPATSGTQQGTNDVIKQKKPLSKPPIQSVFESSTSKPSPPEVNVNKATHKAETNGVSTTNQNTANVTSSVPAATKGILKKRGSEETVVEETKTNRNDALETDDYKKSALIFMTENHDCSEEATGEKRNTKEVKEELHLATNTVQEIPELNPKTAVIENQEDETVELRFNDSKRTNQQKVTENKENSDTTANEHKASTSDSESEQEDVKTVRWRNTVIEIKPPTEEFEVETQKYEESPDDFKVHFVKHQNFSTVGLRPEDVETGESESEDDDRPEVDARYGNRGAYSSQAASIFFAGEEPEPTPRIRNATQQQDDTTTPDIQSSA